MKNRTVPVWLAGVLLLGLVSCAAEEPEGASAVAPFAPPASVPGLVPVAQGWAQTSINAVIFRKNALVTHQDTQYVAFYSNDAALMLGKRRLGTTAWEIHRETCTFRGSGGKRRTSPPIMTSAMRSLPMAG